MKSAFERFEDKFIPVTETGCWLWIAGLDRDGYGWFWFEKKNMKAYVFAFNYFVASIPQGLQIDHLCRVRSCVNPRHLELVTLKENVLRGIGITAINARKTHCLRGHPFNEPNIYRPPGKASMRFCRECFRIHDRAYKMRKRDLRRLDME